MKQKRIPSLLLALSLIFSLVIPAMGAPADGDITILYTNDIHAYIDNTRKDDNGETVSALRYSTVAGYRQAIDADFLVDAGDHIQGTSYGTYDKGRTIINLMNAAGYTAATLGNHEFDYDMDGTRNAIEWADFDYVSCNIINTDGTPLLPSYKVYEADNGKKVAFLGITTPESLTKSTPAYFMDDNGKIVWSFYEGDEGAKLYAVVQSAIDAAAKEADYVIGVGHMGVDEGSAPYTSEDVIRNTAGFTAFIDGHSHTKMEMQKVADKSGKEIVLTQTKCYLEYVGEMTIDAAGNVTTELHDAIELADVTPDSKVKAIEDEIIDFLAEEQERVIAHTDVALNTHNGDERLVRKQETAIGNFCADATYAYFDSRGYDIDAAFMNGGGIRAPLDGDITVKTLKDIYPWGNVLCLVDMTGQQILDGLEFGAKNVNLQGTGESGGFLQVSGLKYEINAAIPDTTQSDDSGIWTGSPTGDYRVSNVQVKNRQTGAYEPLELDKHYAVGGINYTLRQLGDGFAMFTGENIVDGVAVDYMALDEYVRSLPADAASGLPTLKAGMGYDAPEGRIVITNNPPTMYSASVTNGDGSGEYARGVSVSIQADEPESGKRFKEWSGADGLVFKNGSATTATAAFIMPADAVSLTATYEDIPSHDVTVNGGSGSGTYAQGDAVSISANDAPDGQVFDKWQGAEGLEFVQGDANSASAVFTMPDSPVTLKATFRAQSGQGGSEQGGQGGSGQSGQGGSGQSGQGGSGQSTSGGCYVATSVYGSYDCPEVWTLRRFRDEVLAETWYGRLFIRAYYAVSPTAVKLFGDCEWFRSFFRDRLDQMVSDLQADGFESTPYQDRAW